MGGFFAALLCPEGDNLLTASPASPVSVSGVRSILLSYSAWWWLAPALVKDRSLFQSVCMVNIPAETRPVEVWHPLEQGRFS